MQVLGIALGTFLLFLLIAVLVGTFFMWIGAKLAGVKKAGFGNSFLAALGSALVTWLISALFAGVAGIGAIIGFFIGLLLSLLVIKAVYKIDWGKAFLVWVCHLLAEGLTIFIGVVTFASALLTLIK